MILALIFGLALLGIALYGLWLADALGVAATWPRRTRRSPRLDPERASGAARSPGSL